MGEYAEESHGGISFLMGRRPSRPRIDIAPHILCRAPRSGALEGVREVHDDGLEAALGVEGHGDDVEAKARGRGSFGVEIEPRRADDARLLVGRDRLERMSLLLPRSGANLDEDAGA